MARKLAFVLALMGLCLATAVYALGLGNIQSDSSLNEPLSARVPLLGVDADEISSINVDLASAEAFERAGIERPFSLSRLDFEVKSGPDGVYVEITTEEPVKEPFLDFLMEIRWPQGRLVREYTLLLDPPTYAPGETAPATQAPAVAQEERRPQQPAAQQGRQATGSGATTSGAPSLGQVSEVEAPSVGSYTVQANDTLWEVAQDVRPDQSVTLNQTMLALFRENPDAFINDDMNRLKRGAVLRVPERGQIQGIPLAQANAEVQRQIARWQRSRGVAAGGGEGEESTAAQAAAEQTGTAAADGELRVVAPEQGTGEQPASAAQGEVTQALERQVTLLEESNASLEAENEELKAQVEALKREVAQLESRVNLETGQALPGGDGEQAEPLAAEEAVEQGAERAEDAAETSSDAAGAAAQGQDETAEAATAEQPVQTGETTPQAAAAEEAAPEQVQEPVEMAEPEPQPEPEAQPEPQPRPAATPLWQDPMIMGLGGAVVLVLLLLAYMVVRRRGSAAEDQEAKDLSDEIARGLEEDSAPVADQPSPAQAAAAEDEHESPELPPESDPLGEAEVYLAYGRYDQARDVLDRGLQREPDNKDLRLKMLEVLALTHDRGAFEEHAEQLHALVDVSDPIWQRAVEMGREVAPEHPLFGSSGVGLPAEEDFGFDLSASAEEPAEPIRSEEPAQAAAAADEFSDLDFSFEERPSADGETDGDGSDSGDFDLDFDLEETASEEQPAASTGNPEPAAGLEDLEFDLDEPSPENPQTPAQPAPEGGEEDLSLEFDLDEGESMASPVLDDSELSTQSEGSDTTSDDLEDISFDFEEEEPASTGSGEDFEAATRDVDMQSTALDYDAQEAGGAQPTGGAADDIDTLDEVGTKLDLARAYLDMGDSEGARALLDEVVEEGNDAQVKEARELLSQAG